MLKVQARSIEGLVQRPVALDTKAYPEWRKQKRWYTYEDIDQVCVHLPKRNMLPIQETKHV